MDPLHRNHHRNGSADRRLPRDPLNGESRSFDRETPPGPPPLPCTREQLDRFLECYYDGRSSFPSIALALRVSVLELLDWLDHPEIRRVLDRLDRAATDRARSIATHQQAAALTVLEELATRFDEQTEGTRDRQTRRLAAGAILRFHRSRPRGDAPAPAGGNPEATEPDSAASAASACPVDPAAAPADRGIRGSGERRSDDAAARSGNRRFRCRASYACRGRRESAPARPCRETLARPPPPPQFADEKRRGFPRRS